MKDTIYVTSTLPSGAEVTVYEIKGRHIFAASSKAKGADVMPYIMAEVVTIDGKPLTAEQAQDLPARDVMYIMQLINLQIETLNI